MTARNVAVDIVVPVHNEADSIGAVLNEFHDRVAEQDGFQIRFIVCEDGSTDGTVAVLERLRETLPITLITDTRRKGYSLAVLDGLRAATAEYVGCIDSDGQCDPADFIMLFNVLPHADVAVGWRAPRLDPWVRRRMSWAFGVAFSTMFPVRVHDPSCPYVVLRREHLAGVLLGHPGLLRQGFWWEFAARSQHAGLRVAEVPIHHRPRLAGETRVYRPSRVPRIAWEHLLGLRALRRDLRGIHR